MIGSSIPFSSVAAFPFTRIADCTGFSPFFIAIEMRKNGCDLRTRGLEKDKKEEKDVEIWGKCPRPQSVAFLNLGE